ncbi:3-oxo-tetronate kinase [Botrimarina hoheduenensis]|uniref:3-oxo-tetronate kinase n=1 Tax=Botrimarina hoheduenensis TaxID=2528000 RepID=A0A5C5VZA4_9BACT|nr:3-oxo-tetronate kinase [Botrimarina hoheduenensis]TWT43109.1 hypothetical protein Pla111_20590 [Botrimarina hoheduenensis]
MSRLLGCIADDYTGATDLGAMLSRAGMRVLLHFGLPENPLNAAGYDAAIIALKSRSIPARDAVEQSLAALAVLRSVGFARFFFKYCSTFDSTDKGNIGPVAGALADTLDASRVFFCPSFPENGRTVYCGHLFVNGKPLHESGMERHPLNPMTDADLVRVLGRQTKQTVGLLPYSAVEVGFGPAETAADELVAQGVQFVIADALKDLHLGTLAFVAERDVLMTGGSAFAGAIAQACHMRRELAFRLPDAVGMEGYAAFLSGSCSAATQRQVAAFRKAAFSRAVDPLRLAAGDDSVRKIVDSAAERLADGPVMVYSTADLAAVGAAQRELGVEAASAMLEDTLARVAAGLVEKGVRRLVLAGGETSGAVIRELGVEAVRIGPEIAPGVPWVETLDEPRLALALKSGNFGADDFFFRALGTAQ